MSPRTPLLAALLCGCSVFTTPTAPNLPREEPISAVARALDATVALEGDGGPYCAGVLVGDLILTADHCVDDKLPPAAVHFRLRSGGRFDALVVFHDQESDVAVLSPTSLLPPHDATIIAPVEPNHGDRVVVVGHPLGNPWFITTGICNGLRDKWGSRWLLHSSPIIYGNSGGPVFNEYAEVVGIMSWVSLSNGHPIPHIAGAVPRETLIKALAGRTSLVGH